MSDTDELHEETITLACPGCKRIFRADMWADFAECKRCGYVMNEDEMEADQGG